MVTISPHITEGLNYILWSDINSFDRSAVIQELTAKGYYETALWIKNNEKEYTLGLNIGFHVKAETDT